MPVLVYPILWGATLLTGAWATHKLAQKPEQGSVFDSLNDGVNAAPKFAKYAAIGSVATAAALIYTKYRKK
jgi:hypothetical protein